MSLLCVEVLIGTIMLHVHHVLHFFYNVSSDSILLDSFLTQSPLVILILMSMKECTGGIFLIGIPQFISNFIIGLFYCNHSFYLVIPHFNCSYIFRSLLVVAIISLIFRQVFIFNILLLVNLVTDDDLC